MDKPVVLVMFTVLVLSVASVTAYLYMESLAMMREAPGTGSAIIYICHAALSPGASYVYTVDEPCVRLVDIGGACVVSTRFAPASVPPPCVRLNSTSVLVRARCDSASAQRGERILIVNEGGRIVVSGA